MDPLNNSAHGGTKASAQKRANGQGSIYYVTNKQGKKVIKAAISDLTGKRRVKTFKKKAQADDWLADQKQARNLGNNTYATNPKMTVGQYLLGWVETRKVHVKPNTYRGYLSVIKNQIIPHIGKMNAATLSPKAVESFLGDLAANGAGAGTINLTHRAMSAAYNDAVRLRDMPKNPVLLARKPRVKSVATKSIPLEHWQKIYLEAAKNPHTHARIEIAIMVGLRPGEALGLKWSDVDWENSTLTIERQIQRVVGEGLKFQEVKQGGIRTIRISAETLRILQNHKRYQTLQKARWVHDEDLIFTNTLGRMQDEKADRLMFKKLCRDVMVPEYQLYQCRKTAFTNMASQTDLKTLMEFSGHTQVSTVMGSYVFATPESMKSAVNGMDKLRPLTTDQTG